MSEHLRKLKNATDLPDSGAALANKTVRVGRQTNWGPVIQMFEALLVPLGSTDEEKASSIRHAAEIFDGIKPTDEMEGMLVSQMVAMHHAIMECLRRAMQLNQSNQDRSRNLQDAAKLAGLYVRQMDALDKHRGKGQQNIVVKHVHVEAGGNAIVGNVDTAGQKPRPNDQPHDDPRSIPFMAGETLDLCVQSQVPVEILRN